VFFTALQATHGGNGKVFLNIWKQKDRNCKFPRFYSGTMIERQVKKKGNEGLPGTRYNVLMGYGGWGLSDNATGIQPIDFGEVAFHRFFQAELLR
jgi:hypothetical protein